MISSAVVECLDGLDPLREQHYAVLEKFMLHSSSDPNDFIAPAIAAVALNRSLRVIKGYRVLVEQENLTCASALVRLQIDSAMRANALHLTSDPKELLRRVRVGEPLGKMKSSVHPKETLKDRYLHDQLSVNHTWVSALYVDSSGYIHMSKPAADIALAGPDGLGMIVRISETDQPSESELLENVELFVKATALVVDVCRTL